MRVLRSLHWFDLPADAPELSTPAFGEFMQRCFPLIRNSDGSWKLSRKNRHEELDARLAALLKGQDRRPTVFMDVGMANGISTLETIRCLEQAGLPVQTIATDRNLEAYVVRMSRHLDLLVEANGHILLIEWYGWLFSPVSGLWEHATGRSLLKWIVTAWGRRRLARLGLPLTLGQVRPDGVVAGPYRLVTPELQGRPDVVVRTDDILEPTPPEWGGVADVVRVVNVLRPDCFSPAQLRQVATNLRQRCREGGILVVGRNRMQTGVRPRWAATLFRAEPGGGWRTLERLGAGSEVEQFFDAAGDDGLAQARNGMSPPPEGAGSPSVGPAERSGHRGETQ
ncbi:MAG: hypothetical protein ACK6D3_12945 [Planctomycetaceae bacterium]|jgi:hypothetical protein